MPQSRLLSPTTGPPPVMADEVRAGNGTAAIQKPSNLAELDKLFAKGGKHVVYISASW